MTGGDGDVSPPAIPHAGTPISGFSAVPSSASSSDVRRSMKRGIELALAGGSSAATLGSSPPPEPDAPGMHTCCGKSFKSEKAVHGHMRTHKRNKRSKTCKTKRSETKGHGSTVAEGCASSSVADAQKKKEIHSKLDLNEVPADDDEEGA